MVGTRTAWSQTLPAAPGWYWWRENEWEEEVVNVWGEHTLYFQWPGRNLMTAEQAASQGGEWQGPIRPRP